MEEAKILDEANIDHKNKYEEAIKTFADKLEEKINFLKGKADKVEHSAKDTYNERIELLKQKREALSKEYEKVKNTGENKWQEIKGEASEKVKEIRTETETAYTGIRDGFSYLFGKFKN
ncbi:hypothetical protein [Ekhidna sp.]|uniref:hypothetical protein n=1 Tax=Ekhidna sp. TaxID=2608089 RepID=UPI003B5B0DF7